MFVFSLVCDYKGLSAGQTTKQKTLAHTNKIKVFMHFCWSQLNVHVYLKL